MARPVFVSVCILAERQHIMAVRAYQVGVFLFFFIFFRFRFHVFRHPYICPNDRVVAYGYAAENSGVGVYDDVILKNGVALDALDGVAVGIERKAFCSQCHALI